jgi:hypothetical protein
MKDGQLITPKSTLNHRSLRTKKEFKMIKKKMLMIRNKDKDRGNHLIKV